MMDRVIKPQTTLMKTISNRNPSALKIPHPPAIRHAFNDIQTPCFARQTQFRKDHHGTPGAHGNEEDFEAKGLHPNDGVLRTANGVLGTVNGVLRTVNGVLGTANGVLGTVNGMLGTVNEVLRTANGVLRTVNGVLRTANGVIREENGVLEAVNGVLREARPFATSWFRDPY